MCFHILKWEYASHWRRCKKCGKSQVKRFGSNSWSNMPKISDKEWNRHNDSTNTTIPTTN